MATQSQAKSWISAHNHKSVNPDHVYGPQCMDLIVQYCLDLFNWHPYGNAKAMWTQKLPTGWKRLKNTPSLVPQAGDIVVWKPAAWNGYYGHIALATGKGNTSYFQSLDQNWYNASANGSPAAYVNHSYIGTYAIYGVVRPVWSLPVPAATKLSKPLDFTAKLSTTNVWDLTTNPYYKAARTMRKGTRFTAVAQIKFNKRVYYQMQADYDKRNKYAVNAVDLVKYTPLQPPVPQISAKDRFQDKQLADLNNKVTALSKLVDVVVQFLANTFKNFKK